MKLLLCRKCGDVVKLTYGRRECECGAVWGQYRADGWHADVSKEAEVLGINNHVLMDRLARQTNEPLEAWIFQRGSTGAKRVHWPS